MRTSDKFMAKRIIKMDDIVRRPGVRKIRYRRPVSASVTRNARGMLRVILGLGRQMVAAALAFVVLLTQAGAFIAFEAHVVDVKAEIAGVDAPVISPQSGYYPSPLGITITDSDPDATHIFYTVTNGTDSDSAPDPVCGSPMGGPQPLAQFSITADSVVKAIACDSPDAFAHRSLTTFEVYHIGSGGVIKGHKYHDLNQDGALNGGDFPLEGWQIYLAIGTTTIATTATDQNGQYSFMNLYPDTYEVIEGTREGWQATGPSSYTVALADGAMEERNFFNYDTGYACAPKSVSFPSALALQTAGSGENDDIALASNVTVNGSVRSNGDIRKNGGGSNRSINGDATAGGTVDDDIQVSGSVTEGAGSASLPDVMVDEWKARAQDGGTINGSLIFPNGTTGLLLGPAEILGNVEFGSSNGATIRGPLYIHGNLTIGSNTTITQDPLIGDQFITIVVDGTISISSNVAFDGASSTGAFLLISTHAAVTGDDATIETSSNNSDLGDVVLFAVNGDIHIRSNRTLLAAFAGHGTGSDANAAIRLDSNVTVNYRALPSAITCGARQAYESTSHILINEFLPNPAGADNAAKPGGEWVELFNPTASPVDINGWVLYDNDNTHALPIHAGITDTADTIVPPLGHIVVYRDGDSDFSLNNSGGDSVRLFSAPIGSGGILVDSHTYTVSASEQKSFARIPDGSANWVDPEGTPGGANSFFFVPLVSGSSIPFLPAPKPLLMIPAESEVPVSESVSGEGEASQETESLYADEPAHTLPPGEISSELPTPLPGQVSELSQPDSEITSPTPPPSPEPAPSADSAPDGAPEPEPAKPETPPVVPEPSEAPAPPPLPQTPPSTP